MDGVSIHTDGFELKKRPKRHREPGQVPYPREYTSDARDFDIWNHLLIVDMCKSITRHTFKAPPSYVLDIGCGAGMWVIEAAKRWTETNFVGFDLVDMQPNLAGSQPTSLSQRVRWVHGNFLDPLPFGNDEFDFVRIHGIGLGVPEDEWQDILDEVVRILTPEGVLEIIEEDLIFPCHKPPSSVRKTPSLASSLSFHSSSNASAAQSSNEPSSSRKTSSPRTSEEQINDLRDHSELKQSFAQMLTSRFINPKVVSVLPFYLQAAFKNVLCFPTVKMFLPPSSSAVNDYVDQSTFRQSMDSGILVDITQHIVRRASDNDSTDEPLTSRNHYPPASTIAPANVRMSLWRTLQMIKGCKEEMWVEYEKLNRHKRDKPNTRLDRGDFESLFYNYECDMQDRIGMRDIMMSRLAWNEPRSLERPQWRRWKEKIAKARPFSVSTQYEEAESNICRCARAFVCTNAVPADHVGGLSTNFVSTDRGTLSEEMPLD